MALIYQKNKNIRNIVAGGLIITSLMAFASNSEVNTSHSQLGHLSPSGTHKITIDHASPEYVSVDVTANQGTQILTFTNKAGADVGYLSGNSIGFTLTFDLPKSYCSLSFYGMGGINANPSITHKIDPHNAQLEQFSVHYAKDWNTQKGAIWKAGQSLKLSAWSSQNILKSQITHIKTDPLPNFSNAILTLSASVPKAIVHIQNTSTKKMTLTNITNKPKKFTLNFGQYRAIPVVGYQNERPSQMPSNSKPLVFDLSKAEPSQSQVISYQNFFGQTGVLTIDIKHPNSSQTSIPFETEQVGHRFLVSHNIEVSHASLLLPVESYILPKTLSYIAEKKDNLSSLVCTLSLLDPSHVITLSQQGASVHYENQCQWVYNEPVIIQITNDRTLDPQYSHPITLSLMDNQTQHIVKTLHFIYHAQKPTLIKTMLPIGHTYTMLLDTPNGYNAENQKVIAPNDPKKNLFVYVDYKLKGSYRYVTNQQYESLLSMKNGRLDYQIYIPEPKKKIYWHCQFPQSSEIPSQCFDSGTFNLTQLTKHLGSYAHSPQDIAMGLAQASMTQRLLMNFSYGEHPTFQAVNPHIAQSVGEYLADHFNINYLLARGLQEGQSGVYPFSYSDSSGPFQIDSLASQLPKAHQGYPMPFALITQDSAHVKTLQADLIAGAISSAFFDGSDLGIMGHQRAGQMVLKTQYDARSLEQLMSWAYNRGAWSITQDSQPVSPSQVNVLYDNSQHPVSTMDRSYLLYCALNKNPVDNSKCYPQGIGYGTLYVRQLPYYQSELNQVPQHYSAQVTLSDIDQYLDLLGQKQFGFYDDYDITRAKQAAKEAFHQITPGDSIDFQRQFGHVLEAIMTNLPLYTWGAVIPHEGGGGHGGGSTTLNVKGDESLYLQYQDATGLAHNDTVPSNESISLEQKGQILLAIGLSDHAVCNLSILNDHLHQMKDITLTLSHAQCSIANP